MIVSPRRFRTPRAKRRERWRRLAFGALCVGACVLVVSGIFYLAHAPHFRVARVTVEGLGSVLTPRIETVVYESLRGSIAFFVPRNNVFAIHTGSVAEALQSAIPELRDVTVERGGLDTIRVRASLRTPMGLWCGDVVPTLEELATLHANCYHLDATGFIFSHAQEEGLENSVPRIFSALTEGGPVGRYALTGQEFEEVRSLWSSVERLELSPRALLLVDERDAELYLDTGQVLFLRSETREISNILTALREHGTITPHTSFLYLDLRFGGKAYLNRKGSSSDVESDEASSPALNGDGDSQGVPESR